MAQQRFRRLQEEPPEGAVHRERARPGEAAEGVEPDRHVWTSGTRRRLRALTAPPPGALHGPVEGVLPPGGAPRSGTSLCWFHFSPGLNDPQKGFDEKLIIKYSFPQEFVDFSSNFHLNPQI